MHILLVEDNPIDVRAAKRAAKSLERDVVVAVVANGDDAIAYLADGEHESPELVLLDLNLPGRDGFDVLRAIKGSAEHRRVPIIVVTTSSSDADVRSAYDLGANAYLVKPDALAGWQALFRSVEQFWFDSVRLP